MQPIALALLILTLAPGSPAQTMFHGGPSRSGVLQAQAPRQFHRVKWRFATGDRVVSSPIIENGVVYVGSDDGNIYAVDAATGRQKWKRTTGGPVPSTPAIANGTVYAGSYDGRFYALDAASGAVRWKFTTGGERRFEARGIHGLQPKNQTIADPYDTFLSSPVVAQGAVYFGSGDGNVYALDATTGDLRWKFQTGDVVHASPAYADGTLYFGSWDSFFYAVDAVTGKQKWRFKSGEDPLIHNQVGFQSSPAVVGGIVYTGCRDSHLYAIDAATGKERWKFFNGGSWVITSPAVVNGKVIFGTSDTSFFYIMDATTGKDLVKQQSKAFLFSSPVVAGDVVLTGVLNGTLEARDLNSGDLLWEFRTETSKRNPGWTLTSEGKINGPFLYYSSWREAGILGSERQFGNGAIFSTPLVDRGVVYVGSNDGYLYALE